MGRKGNSTSVGSREKAFLIVRLLRAIKGVVTYRKLMEATGINMTSLARYVSGRNMPNRRNREYLEKMLKPLVEEKIINELDRDSHGFFDNTFAIFHPAPRMIFALWVLDQLKNRVGSVTKVLTASTDGVTLATTVADVLGVPVVIAKKEPEAGVAEFITARVVRTSGDSFFMFVPKKWLNRKDNVLVVDDVARTGETQRALLDIVRKARARPAGLFVMIGVRGWQERIRGVSCPMGAMIEVSR